MKKFHLVILCYFLLGISNTKAQANADKRHISFDTGWLFNKTNIASGPEQSGFDVSGMPVRR